MGKFVRGGLERHVGPDLEDGVRAALLHYLGRIESGRPPLAPPGFVAMPPDATAEAVEVLLDREAMALLRRAAAAHGVTPEALAAHSVVVFLAELDFLAPSEPDS